MEYLVFAVLAGVAIVTMTAIAPRVGLSAPLLLVVLGLGASLLPFIPDVEVSPEFILAGVLPPLVYATSVGMPTMDFRRDFNAISGLSVILVVLSALILGLLFSWLIPGVPLALGVALGAIVSPTDAVATTIIRRLGVSPRVVIMLEGESLLNDATALVLMRSALAAAAGSISMWGVAGRFVYAVIAAVGVGFVVGWAGLYIRHHITQTSTNTAISFIVPFLSYIPAEVMGASGLVATMTAGLVTSIGSARFLRPQDRIAEETNWRTLEVLLEGAVFLLMGLQLHGLVTHYRGTGGSLWFPVVLGLGAAVIALVVRAGYLAPLLWLLNRRARRGQAVRKRLETVQQHVDEGELGDALAELEGGRRGPAGRRRRKAKSTLRKLKAEQEGDVEADGAQRHQQTFSQRLGRRLADIDYLVAEPLGVREGAVMVWAGLRGAVTVAAAQSLPPDTEHRSALVLIAFTVAASTLLVQGATLPAFVTWLGVARPTAVDPAERAALNQTLTQAVGKALDDDGLRRTDGSPFSAKLLDRTQRMVTAITQDSDADGDSVAQQAAELQRETLKVQREALLAERRIGSYSSAALREALTRLDAEQIGIEMRFDDENPG